jgi:hypothetical protein
LVASLARVRSGDAVTRLAATPAWKGRLALDTRGTLAKWRLAFGGAAPADPTSRLAAVRCVFTAYVLLITVGLAFYIAIGITNH